MKNIDNVVVVVVVVEIIVVVLRQVNMTRGEESSAFVSL